MKRGLIGAAIVAGLVIIIIIIANAVRSRGAAPHYITAPVKTTSISATIQETGSVIPVTEVDVGTQVSGTVATLNVDYNSIVKKGQVLATLDPTSFQAASNQAHAALDAAQSTAAAASASAAQQQGSYEASLANKSAADAAVNSALANLNKANAQVVLSKATVARDHSLLSQGYISQSQLDTDVAANSANIADVSAAQAAYATAQAQDKAASAQVAVASAQHSASIDSAGAAQAQAQASSGQAAQADYNLAHAIITSPIDGIVVSRSVDVGTTVAASFQTPTLFVIASNLKDMEVDATVSEADVGQLSVGDPAQISVPAYPNVVFNGTVKQIRVNPTTTQNVVTYDAIVAVHDESQRLFPGMTANVTISVGSSNSVLSVPTAALLYHPSSSSGGQSPSSGGGAFAAISGPASPAPIAGAPGSKVVVYKLVNDKPQAVPIVIGLSDGHNYEVRSGDLKAGDLVIVGQLQAHQFSNSNPLGGGFPR
jgi:HlyD family secretion protein